MRESLNNTEKNYLFF